MGYALKVAILDLICNSPNLKELTLDCHSLSIKQALKNASPSLRKITIEDAAIFGNLGNIFKLLCDRERKWRQNENPLDDQHLLPTISDSSSCKTQSMTPDKKSQGQLEELRIGYDLALYNSATMAPFHEYYRNPASNTSPKSITSSMDWGLKLFKVCPNLKKINFGGITAYAFLHLDEVLETYMSQLESVILWGISILPVRRLDVVFRPETTSRSTELDISASSRFNTAIPAVLRSGPNLRQLLAMSVEVMAQDIAEFDWVCQGLECLALCIFVPFKRSSYSRIFNEDQLSSQVNTNLEIKIYQQLGRLIRLCELKLEGPTSSFSDVREAGGRYHMRLSVFSGLIYLEPLKNSLEVLDLSKLNSKIDRSRETIWIARQWIYHRHPEQHSRLNIDHRLDGTQLQDLCDEINALDKCSPAPRLRELCIPSETRVNDKVRRAGPGLQWLSSICPTLRSRNQTGYGVCGANSIRTEADD
ncbi:hypothetical protein BGW38_002352 [Lunasporangiospora selenospora]|uniref:Uncharacterized protein n=1 Tax=Lunasporangiospora selenospora TaxID=979761 RepID=A0A9P6KDG1_9FUNG|nr:hypothetical protein BGW38_002352 [Lunasporangiospora selenospora]